jgi:hypothetical protein
MGSLEYRFVQRARVHFQFLEEQGFERRVSPKRVVLYIKPAVFVRVWLKDTRVAVTLGRVIKGKAAAEPNDRRPKTFSNAFRLEDLAAFRTQAPSHPMGEYRGKLTLNRLDGLLRETAEALKRFGRDVLKGDLSVLEDLAIINRNNAGKFLP